MQGKKMSNGNVEMILAGVFSVSAAVLLFMKIILGM
jgi:hypothetical protein